LDHLEYDIKANHHSQTPSAISNITGYYAAGRPDRSGPNGLVTTLGYDARGRLISRTVGAEVTAMLYASGVLRRSPCRTAFPFYSYDGPGAHGVTDALGNRIA